MFLHSWICSPLLPLSGLKDEDVQPGLAWRWSPRCVGHGTPGPSPWTGRALTGWPPPARHTPSHQASPWSWGHWWQSPPLCCAGNPQTSLQRQKGERGNRIRGQHSEIYSTRCSQIPDTSGRLKINLHPSRRILKYLIPSAVTFDSPLWRLWQNKLLICFWTGIHGGDLILFHIILFPN